MHLWDSVSHRDLHQLLHLRQCELRSIAEDDENVESPSSDEDVKQDTNVIDESSDDDKTVQGKGRKSAAPRGRGRASATAAKRGRKSDSSSSSLQRMLMDVDDDDNDMTKKENKPRPRISDVSESIFGDNHIDVLKAMLILFRQIKFEKYFSMKYVNPI